MRCGIHRSRGCTARWGTGEAEKNARRSDLPGRTWGTFCKISLGNSMKSYGNRNKQKLPQHEMNQLMSDAFFAYHSHISHMESWKLAGRSCRKVSRAPFTWSFRPVGSNAVDLRSPWTVSVLRNIDTVESLVETSWDLLTAESWLRVICPMSFWPFCSFAFLVFPGRLYHDAHRIPLEKGVDDFTGNPLVRPPFEDVGDHRQKSHTNGMPMDINGHQWTSMDINEQCQ